MKKSILESILATIVFAAIVLPLCAQAQMPTAVEFADKAAIGGMFEIKSSQIALERSHNPNIRKMANMLIDDHTKIGDELARKLPDTEAKDTDLPDSLDDAHQMVLDQLKNAPDSSFDRFYLKSQLDAHKEAVKLFSSYAKSGDDQVLKTFAIENLPTLKSHLSRVKTLQLSY